MATMEGSLSKWTNVMKGWQYRWFVLDDNAGLLSYYTSKEKMMRGVRRGCVRLKGAVIGIDDEDDSTFTITVDGKTFHFQARDAEERERWIRALEDTILRHAHRMRWDPNRPTPSIQEFDKKLTEADAYLQILIDQTKALELRIDTLEDAGDKARCSVIKSHADDMLDSIKHSIVLLQIAKNTLVNSAFQVNHFIHVPDNSSTYNLDVDLIAMPVCNLQNTAHPVNGIYPAPTNTSTYNLDNPELMTKRTTQSQGAEDVSLPGAMLPEDVQQGIEFGAECMEARRLSNVSSLHSPSLTGLTSPGGSHHRASMTLIVPETSYSSSEEEDFYDANEYNDTPSSTHSPLGLRPFVDASTAEVTTEPAAQPSESRTPGGQRPPPVTADGSLDYDALYEDESDHDLGSMESHGSVVTHLLSQVKIGMDLTKVVLPTFILERRSLLEMYADYFAHPDIFVSIADFSDPKDRMVQVVRWYMSAYHAGRKSAVAKKPYNPVIGEVFQCHWNVPGLSTEPEAPVSDGPVPWCTRNQLTFVSEQVSHHPPISAFYAEHYNKRISFCAHVWTKSKFLGLSIGVHNIGQGCVSVLDYDEEYIVTFPNGYGRSILTVPWIELGGSVTITCAKSGYNANLEFLTKPFYGGKKHRISAEVFQPGEKKPFLTVNGEWNACMEAKWADGRMEVFVDVNSIPITKKRVRPIANQAANESRRLWKEVTAGLRLNDIERATGAKYDLEQQQRAEALDRKENGLKWETKVFQEAGENWVYRNPLVNRLTLNRPTPSPH